MLHNTKRREVRALPVIERARCSGKESMTSPLSDAFTFDLDYQPTSDCIRQHGELAKCLVGCSWK